MKEKDHKEKKNVGFFLLSVCTGYWLHSIECPQLAVVKYTAKLLWKG